ncbi:hypothetical protein PVOR_23919 [Paenibacillus vortex V453]|uniref:Uncharacterized protein n=1 Tax=Paenibacillus vortex V453 TaxID=715225 RepID=A0A2R9SQL5_9BACL|nr:MULTISPECIES: hypothetical protein [Paenibacillus]EFU39632.1 hypothetical protein PVOR_23919 [Paenibacillus vortex V453]OMF80816.1 hypothetical protein BK142_05220 [Paenibacillus glucanolyticus]
MLVSIFKLLVITSPILISGIIEYAMSKESEKRMLSFIIKAYVDGLKILGKPLVYVLQKTELLLNRKEMIRFSLVVLAILFFIGVFRVVEGLNSGIDLTILAEGLTICSAAISFMLVLDSAKRNKETKKQNENLMLRNTELLEEIQQMLKDRNHAG